MKKGCGEGASARKREVVETSMMAGILGGERRR